MNDPLKYEGTKEYQPQPGTLDSRGQILNPYLPSDDLVEAVNLAIALKMPLLLEGEPGCGKTKLARAIAYEFTQKHLKSQGIETEWTYEPWYVKSDTRAKDGIYTFDAIGRLRDAQLLGTAFTQLRAYLVEDDINTLIGKFRDITKYRTWQPLGKALQQEHHRPILLIDEIDKADVDFPNDLLRELEELSTTIPETGETLPRPSQPPIIIITSNQEKPLPDAFLRRCIYFFVEFPEDRLLEIAKERYPDWVTEKEDVYDEAVERLLEVRDTIQKRPGGKPPGISEFLESLQILLNKPVDEAMEDLKQLASRLPLLGILLKTKEDQEFFQQHDPAKDDE